MRLSKVDMLRIEIRAASLYACQVTCEQNSYAECVCWEPRNRLDKDSEAAAEDLYRVMNGAGQ